MPGLNMSRQAPFSSAQCAPRLPIVTPAASGCNVRADERVAASAAGGVDSTHVAEVGGTMSFERSRRQFLKRSAVLMGLSAATLLRSAGAEERFVEAATTFGRVRGADAGGIMTFKGIPYGASTAGAARFRPPANPAAWTGVRDALAYGPSAPQREPGVARTESALGVAAANLPS